MNKIVFKSLQQSLIQSTFLNFYFPDTIQHPIVEAVSSFNLNSKKYCLNILNAKTECELECISDDLYKKFKHFNELSKYDFPGLNYFFSSIYKNSFDFQSLKQIKSSGYEKMPFFEKIKLTVPLLIPERYIPSAYVKKFIFENFGFQYLHIPHGRLTLSQIDKSFHDFIQKTQNLMNHMNMPEKSISLNGQLGLFIEEDIPLYAHLPKAIGFTKDISMSTLLHEWTHSIDNHIFHQLTGINDYASENLHNFTIKNPHFLPAYQAIKKVLFEVCNFEDQKPNNHHEVIGKKPSIYFHNCMAADEDLFITATQYYQKPCEILARMVESGEFPEHTHSLNKNLTNLVYLTKELNPYADLKEAFFSVVAKPTYKVAQIREQNGLIPEMDITILKNGIGKQKF